MEYEYLSRPSSTHGIPRSRHATAGEVGSGKWEMGNGKGGSPAKTGIASLSRDRFRGPRISPHAISRPWSRPLSVATVEGESPIPPRARVMTGAKAVADSPPIALISSQSCMAPTISCVPVSLLSFSNASDGARDRLKGVALERGVAGNPTHLAGELSSRGPSH